MKHRDEIFMLWIGDELPELQQLSLKSLLLTGHKVKFYTYEDYPESIELARFGDLHILDANDIIPKDKIWRYTISDFGKGSVSGFANHWRLVYLNQFGGTWVDFDILAIRNLSEMYTDQEILIGSELTGKGERARQRPNNNLLSFPKDDPLVKRMLDISNEVGSNAEHAQTGPKLLNKLLRSKDWKTYSKFVLPYLSVGPITYDKSRSFVKDSPTKVCEEQNIDINQVYGFHVWNTYFTVNTKTDVLNNDLKDDSIYAVMRDIIKSSSTKKEYIDNVAKVFPQYQKELIKKASLF